MPFPIVTRVVVLILVFATPVLGFGENENSLPKVAAAPEFVIPSSKLINMNHPDRIPNRFIVVFKDDAELAKDVPPAMAAELAIAPGEMPTSSEAIARIGLSLAGRYRSKRLVPKDENQDNMNQLMHIFTKALRGFSLDAISDSDAVELAKDPRIKYVEAVLRARTEATQGSAPWDLDRIDQPQTLDGLYHYSATGAGVTVWVLDSGIQFTHNEFQGRAGTADVYFEGCGMGQDCSNYYKICQSSGACTYYYPYLQPDAAKSDICGHGTAVASVVGGAVSGVAKGVTLIGVNLEEFGCTLSTDVIIAGIDYVLNHKASNTNIINLSIEVAVNDPWNPTFENAVAAAVNSGIVFITAAGNDASNACSYDPGRLPYVITVGASAQNDLVSSYSNYGSCITLFAPGDHVRVADNGYDLNMDNTGTAVGSNVALNTISGTSFAAPIVSGIAALYLQNNPGASPATVKSAIQSAAWVGKLRDTRQGALPSPNLLASVCVPGNFVCPQGAIPAGKLPPFLELLERLLLFGN